MLTTIEVIRFIECGHINSDNMKQSQLDDITDYIEELQELCREANESLCEFDSKTRNLQEVYESHEQQLEDYEDRHESSEPYNPPVLDLVEVTACLDELEGVRNLAEAVSAELEDI